MWRQSLHLRLLLAWITDTAACESVLLAVLSMGSKWAGGRSVICMVMMLSTLLLLTMMMMAVIQNPVSSFAASCIMSRLFGPYFCCVLRQYTNSQPVTATVSVQVPFVCLGCPPQLRVGSLLSTNLLIYYSLQGVNIPTVKFLLTFSVPISVLYAQVLSCWYVQRLSPEA
jgi:hypothetical protein